MIAQKRLKVAIVSLVTGSNLLLGVAAIVLASLGHGRIAVACLMFSIVADAFDGFLARKWKVFSQFGAELDSLADLTSFVVANAVLIFFWFFGEIAIGYQILAASIFLLGGAFRLARFNVWPTRGAYFQGIPTTAVAVLVGLIYLTHPDLDAVQGLAWQGAMGFLMVSNLPYPKFGAAQVPLVVKVAVLGLFIYSFWDLSMAVAIGCASYVLCGPILHVSPLNTESFPVDPDEDC